MFCEKCGTPLVEGSNFCEECGAPVNAPAQPVAAQPENVPVQTEPTPTPTPMPAPTPVPTPNQQPQPVNYAQPQQPNMYAGGMPPYAQPKRKKDGKVAIVIVLSVLVALLIGVVVFLLLTQKNLDTKPVEEETKKEETTVTKQETKEETEPASSNPDEEARSIAAYYSTEEKPNIATFDWFTQYIVPTMETNTGMPVGLESASVITNRMLVEGGWKMIVVWDPNRLRDAYCWDLENAIIETMGDSVKLSIVPYIFYEPDLGITSDLSNQPINTFAGAWENDSFLVETPGTRIFITNFYEQGVYQYGIGHIVAPDGTRGYVALVRP